MRLRYVIDSYNALQIAGKAECNLCAKVSEYLTLFSFHVHALAITAAIVLMATATVTRLSKAKTAVRRSSLTVEI
jgi:hypothetical protein